MVDELASALSVQLVVHGHHHDTYRRVSRGYSVQGVGQATVVDFEGRIVSEVTRGCSWCCSS